MLNNDLHCDVNAFNSNAQSEKSPSFSCLLKNNRFGPSRLNFNLKANPVSTWFGKYTEGVKDLTSKCAIVVDRSEYIHTNSNEMSFYAEGSWIFPKNLDSFLYDDYFNRHSFFGMFKHNYTKRAKSVYYGFENLAPDYEEALPFLTTSRAMFKKRVGYRILTSKSTKNKVFLFKKSFMRVFNNKYYSLNNRSTLLSRFKKFSYSKYTKSYVKNLYWKGFYPTICLIKKTLNTNILASNLKMTFTDLLTYQQFRRHPSSQIASIRKVLKIGTGMDSFFTYDIDDVEVVDHSRFYKIYWKYFKFKVEKFFYNQINTRVHIWFLNIWDIFLNSIDALWRWFRYENKAVYFLTKKGQRFLIEDREDAKFYLRTLTLTITMVGGAKLFMDKISLMMRRYRNNWAFILHTAKTLRMSINYFWFRFFVNYKITLQGKIGGFLRAQKKVFKKGNVSVENKESAITYYRGFPVTRFGSYNLSFWLQYRIPNLIRKFGDSTYIDTMQVLLSMYSVPWLAGRLYEIIKKMLMERVYVVNRKLTQYDRRSESRQTLIYDVLKVKKYHYQYSSVRPGNIHRYKQLRDVILKKKSKEFFTKPFRSKILNELIRKNENSNRSPARKLKIGFKLEQEKHKGNKYWMYSSHIYKKYRPKKTPRENKTNGKSNAFVASGQQSLKKITESGFKNKKNLNNKK